MTVAQVFIENFGLKRSNVPFSSEVCFLAADPEPEMCSAINVISAIRILVLNTGYSELTRKCGNTFLPCWLKIYR